MSPSVERTDTAAQRTDAAPPTACEQAGRWLDLDQQRHWRRYLIGSAYLLEALTRQLEQDAGLSFHEYELLVRLSEAEGRTLRMSELADAVVYSRSRLTHTVRRLEERGIVARTTCLEDGRGVNCVLTDAGFAALVAAAPGHVSAVRELLVDRLSPEQFAALGDAMATAFPEITAHEPR